ncbi:DNA polymerase III, subunit gamma/tau [Rivularia sp. PCC 7116]|uniref:DNA polymerase III subunit gamma/tau n=1 Tax=Rivularia sp. PCC 7116 TaxID=373994 RepID=UPI00029EEC52|nr:DNA polymerase III subunit gamma/tau [Rivularia sp. PCC 7116]AFY56211.1 DNA polymerase III, subunit gamma/tau [Rivularia sp. PCC 7116]
MSYEPLHHKYRPKTFAELVGQEAIATTLTNAIHTLKIAPAYLFTGPRGTGKTSSARILAKSLNCLNSDKPTSQPCGKCDVCQGINKGATLDVIEIDAASNTGVDNIREIIERAQFAPVQCRYKVYVVDECHMLSTQAFNALLKTLEEPPLHVVFVLATTDPQRVLPTIISRCQRFDFRRIPMDGMVQHLTTIAAQENIDITKEAVTLVAQVSQGGLRDAQSLLDQLSLLSGQVIPEKVWDLVGSVSEQGLLELLKAIISDNSEAVIDSTRQILDRGREPLIILQNLASFYRDLLIAKTAPSRNDLVACTQAMWKVLIDVAQSLEISMILQGQQHLRAAEVQIKNTTQPRLWLEVTLLGLLPSATISIAPANNNQQKLPSFPSNPPSTNQHPLPPPPQQTPPATTPKVAPSHPPASNNKVNTVDTVNTETAKPQENATRAQTAPSNSHANNNSSPPPQAPPQAPPETNLNQLWQQVLTNLIPVSRRELLRQMCRVADFDGSLARVAVKEKWYEKVKEEKSKIEAAFEVTFNRKIEINLEVASSISPTNSNSSPAKTVHQPPAAPAHLNTQTVPQTPPQPVPSPVSSPTPERTQPPQISAPKTQANTAIKNPINSTQTIPTPPQPTPIEEDPEASEVMKAALRLAQALDGEIIQLNDEKTEISDESIDSSELEEIEEDDVEF